MIEAAIPIVETLEVEAAHIGGVIGYGGETIRDIQHRSGATVVVPKVGEVRTVLVWSDSAAAVDEAMRAVRRAVRASRREAPVQKAVKTEMVEKAAPKFFSEKKVEQVMLTASGALPKGQGDATLASRMRNGF